MHNALGSIPAPKKKCQKKKKEPKENKKAMALKETNFMWKM
jgi:hypothetical protein